LFKLLNFIEMKKVILFYFFSLFALNLSAQWQQVGGQARDIGVGANGTVWVIGWTSASTSYNIGRWNGSYWEDIPGAAVRIDVDPNGNAWVVNDAGLIYRWNGQNWDNIGGQAHDIGIGANGAVWVVGWTAVPGGYNIARWNGSYWEDVPGGAVSIDVDPSGNAWCTNSDGLIFKWTGRDWQVIEGQGRDITVGADGTAWVLGWSLDRNINNIFKRNGNIWEVVEGNLTSISAGPNGSAWGRNVDGLIYKWAGETGSNGTRVMTQFDPTRHGFKFANTFQNNGYYMGVNINFSGLCGGMSYAALDYYFSNTDIPPNTDTPNEGTQLTAYIRGRQWNTYATQGDKWVELVFNPFGWRTSEFWNWGVQGFNGGRLEELRREIDRGNPVVLGLFAAGSGGISSSHHQVIAIGYDLGRYKGDLKGSKEDLKIFICDPNYPTEIMILRPSESRLRYYYELTDAQREKGIPDKEWLTYFVDLKYTATRPLDPNVINRCTNINFENQNLSGQTHNQKVYRCAKASGVNFRGSNVSGTDLENAELSRAVFYGANCRNTSFAGADLSNANYQGADLKNCTFSSANLENALFYGADLKDVTMKGANAQNGNFEGADLHRGKLSYTSFKNARLFRTSLNTTDCSFVDFSGANLDGADLRGSNLNQADFQNAIVTRNTKFDPNSLSRVKNWPGVR
jgi:uncharacterized protein YjbI with pentapeptide repeats